MIDDHIFDGVDISDRPIIKVAAPYKRLKSFDETLARCNISSYGTTFNPDHTLPILADAFIIKLGPPNRDR